MAATAAKTTKTKNAKAAETSEVEAEASFETEPEESPEEGQEEELPEAAEVDRWQKAIDDTTDHHVKANLYVLRRQQKNIDAMKDLSVEIAKASNTVEERTEALKAAKSHLAGLQEELDKEEDLVDKATKAEDFFLAMDKLDALVREIMFKTPTPIALKDYAQKSLSEALQFCEAWEEYSLISSLKHAQIETALRDQREEAKAKAEEEKALAQQQKEKAEAEAEASFETENLDGGDQ